MTSTDALEQLSNDELRDLLTSFIALKDMPPINPSTRPTLLRYLVNKMSPCNQSEAISFNQQPLSPKIKTNVNKIIEESNLNNMKQISSESPMASPLTSSSFIYNGSPCVKTAIVDSKIEEKTESNFKNSDEFLSESKNCNPDHVPRQRRNSFSLKKRTFHLAAIDIPQEQNSFVRPPVSKYYGDIDASTEVNVGSNWGSKSRNLDTLNGNVGDEFTLEYDYLAVDDPASLPVLHPESAHNQSKIQRSPRVHVVERRGAGSFQVECKEIPRGSGICKFIFIILTLSALGGAYFAASQTNLMTNFFQTDNRFEGWEDI